MNMLEKKIKKQNITRKIMTNINSSDENYAD